MESIVGLFAHWQSKLEAHSNLREYFSGDLKFRIFGESVENWVIHFGVPTSVIQEDGEATCILELEERDLLELASKTLNPQSLFNLGRIKVYGDTEAALNLFRLID